MCNKRKGVEMKKMYAAESVIVRVSIILGIVAAVVTILYFSPIPDHYFKSCDRPCHELDYPMICRIKITLETNHLTESSCNECLQNDTICDYKKCLEGNLQNHLAVNRPQLPSIQVCQNDVLVVDVENKIGGRSLAIHWRGQPQNESPFMDGVPMITQCPIPSYTTFQYKFRASVPGTHIWQAHSHTDTNNGIFGALIVRQSDKIDPHKRLYDVDSKSHVILISEWSSNENVGETSNDDDNVRLLYINGKSIHSGSMETFKVEIGKRYRFRVAYASSIRNCPITLTIERHVIKVISTDGHPTNPYEVSSITIAKGERIDFVLKAKQNVGSYYVKVKSVCDDSIVEGLAVIEYEEEDKGNMKIDNNNNNNNNNKKRNADDVFVRNFNTVHCEDASNRNVCIEDFHSLKKIPNELRRDVDKTIYLAYDYEYYYTKNDASIKPIQKKLFKMNNITFTYPPSPLLTQKWDIPKRILCNREILENCNNQTICECVHIINIPLKSTVELILHDLGGDSNENIFHLHGYSFYVVGGREFTRTVDLETLTLLNDEDMLFKRNLINPVIKDTIRVPRFSTIGLRFIANNPGYWILRDEKSLQWTRGMDVIFKVGDERNFNLPPSSFPSCGSWRGPDFFFT